MLKFVCVLSLLVLTFGYSDAAPHSPKSILDMSQAELMHKFEQFIQEDKQAAAIRQSYEQELHEHKLRKRQADEMDQMDGDQDTDVQKAEGFLDRAAKFVLELVQRFLKWINTE